MNNELPSILLDRAVGELAQLPGIGRKTALRLVLHLLKQDEERVLSLSDAIVRMKKEICYCERCHNISDNHLCPICANNSRATGVVCVVEGIKDVVSIEKTAQYKGVYHVLGGIISPMEGVAPSDLNIESLIHRIKKEEIKEVILALSTTMEGDTTNFYIYKKMKGLPVKITTLARGVAHGDELEYADELTLARSIKHRTLYEDTLAI